MKHKKMLIPVLVATFVVLLIALLYYTNHLPFWRHTPAAHTTGSTYTKGEPASTSTDKATGSPSGSTTNGKSTPSADNTQSSNQPLTAPWGTFANTYTAASNDQMQSTCNTTPGASCEIIFTNGVITKTLGAQTADAGGAVYWAWTPRQIGLTPGTWHLTAKAVLGSQTKTVSNDPLTLEITS